MRTIVENKSKITFERANNNHVIITWYERMGSRWVQLGASETWNCNLATEEYGVEL